MLSIQTCSGVRAQPHHTVQYNPKMPQTYTSTMHLLAIILLALILDNEAQVAIRIATCITVATHPQQSCTCILVQSFCRCTTLLPNHRLHSTAHPLVKAARTAALTSACCDNCVTARLTLSLHPLQHACCLCYDTWPCSTWYALCARWNASVASAALHLSGCNRTTSSL